MEQPGAAGQLEAVRRACDIGPSTWQKIPLADRSALLGRAGWANAEPTAKRIFEKFRHRGRAYFFPADDFTNGTCVEYPLADEQLGDYLQRGSKEALLLLTAVLCREADEDRERSLQRDDVRTPLHGRREIELRAERLQGLPEAYQAAALLYFVGVKHLVHKLYGSWLFEPPDEEGEEPAQGQGDPLGWWGMYLDAAQGDVTKLEQIHQSNFHNFCLLEVRRRKQLKEAELRQRMNSHDFGRP